MKKKKRATKLLLDTYYGTEDTVDGNNDDVYKEENDKTYKEENDKKYKEENEETMNQDSCADNADNSNPGELDRKDFDVNKYLGRVLATLPLCDLLGEEQRLGSEARALDGEMKTLVYQNYHKFVIATNTIDAMHRNVGTIESELHRLAADVSTAGDCISSISAGLDAKCARLRHLRSVSAHLSRLRFAVDLPHKLEQCLAMGAYREAVDCYLRTAALFEHNRTLPSFARISAECSSIVAELKKRLWDELAAVSAQPPPPGAGRDAVAAFARTFPSDRVADAAVMLVDLGEPAGSVRETFLNVSYSKVAFGAALDALALSTTAAEVEASSSVFFGLLLQAYNGYMRSFYNKNDNDEDNIDNDNCNNEDNIDDIDDIELRNMLSRGVEAYISSLQKWLTTYAQSGPSPLPLVDSVAFLERLYARAKQTAASLPRVALVGHVVCVAGDYLGLLVDRVFGDALDTAVAAAIPLLSEGCSSHAVPESGGNDDSEFSQFWESASGRAAEGVATALNAAIAEVRGLVDAGIIKSFEDCIPDLVIRVHSEIQRFFFNLRERPLLALALCGTVTKLTPVVDSVCSKVAEEFELDPDGVTVIHVGEIHSVYSAFVKDLVDAFVTAESAFLNITAATYACELSSSSSKENHSSLNDFIQGIMNVDACLTALFQVSPADKSMRYNNRKFYEMGSGNNINKNDDSSEYFSYEHILRRVSGNAVRAFSECVRLHAYPEGNTFVADRHTLESALVGCYGGLSELSIMLDKAELDVQQRTIKEENDTELKSDNDRVTNNGENNDDMKEIINEDGNK